MNRKRGGEEGRKGVGRKGKKGITGGVERARKGWE